ncbi:hypothetical protein HYPSUDRAFT_208507 [Hypholoma sublateritium FD-334 SS-4]|uniref:Uncharacterized protein n=1 Tax=Hypholoma sublateritium (strain FD-334 SS-4) TaxID=945553 RepID=A0A0D2LV48_HYPSF|nr:hypothetical protein HYPSUDRAFT_208507 [Hypholoma sublateritium FD-334 SS-4]
MTATSSKSKYLDLNPLVPLRIPSTLSWTDAEISQLSTLYPTVNERAKFVVQYLLDHNILPEFLSKKGVDGVLQLFKEENDGQITEPAIASLMEYANLKASQETEVMVLESTILSGGQIAGVVRARLCCARAAFFRRRSVRDQSHVTFRTAYVAFRFPFFLPYSHLSPTTAAASHLPSSPPSPPPPSPLPIHQTPPVVVVVVDTAAAATPPPPLAPTIGRAAAEIMWGGFTARATWGPYALHTAHTAFPSLGADTCDPRRLHASSAAGATSSLGGAVAAAERRPASLWDQLAILAPSRSHEHRRRRRPGHPVLFAVPRVSSSHLAVSRGFARCHVTSG